MPRSEPVLRGAWKRLIDALRATRDAVASLPAWPLLGGMALGFGLCCAAGRITSEQAMFENFTRFYRPIGPATYFYPTASELVSQVRRTVPRSKYLVLVGGASYLRGTGQNPKELWSLELQRLLGDDYAVVNYANDAAGVTEFASVAFQSLAGDYPRIAYVANGNPVVVDPVGGGEVYEYAFWDAYYKRMFPVPAPWSDAVTARAKAERKDPAKRELHLGKWTDQFTYACDLWTYVGYKYFFSVWTDDTAASVTKARRLYVDPVNPALDKTQAALRQDPDYNRKYEGLNKDYATKGFVENKGGQLELDPGAFEHISQLSTSMFPDNLKPKCFLVFLSANPYFMRTFTADDWRRHEIMFREGQRAFEHAGYRVVPLRDADFAPDDFFDAGHFMASGGRKIAQAIALALKAPAAKNPAPVEK
jgi:hypothetical protein